MGVLPALALAGILLLSATAPASARGTVLALYNILSGPTTAGSNPTWVSPSPLRGSPPGCTNLPAGFVPRSGTITWDASNVDAEYCSYAVFFWQPNCNFLGNEPAIKAASRATTFSNFATSTTIAARQIPNTVSVGCSFTSNPCVKYGCADPNAVCSSYIFNINDTSSSASGRLVAAFSTLDCSQCRYGYTKVNGLCVDPCAGYSCPSGATCQLDSSNQPFCQCPDTFQYNIDTKTCVSIVDQLWLVPINNLRTLNNAIAPAIWNDTLAQSAAGWAANVSASQCANGPFNVKLSKLPNSGVSESDAYISYTVAESAAVNLWASPNPTNTSNPRVARMVSNKTISIGCGKAYCVDGAFFTCLFSPFTY